MKLHFQFIEDELKKSTWFAGEQLTGAGPKPPPTPNPFLNLFPKADFPRSLFPHSLDFSSSIDIMMSFAIQMSLVRAESMGVELEGMKAFVKRMEEQEAYKRVVERVGPIGI